MVKSDINVSINSDNNEPINITFVILHTENCIFAN